MPASPALASPAGVESTSEYAVHPTTVTAAIDAAARSGLLFYRMGPTSVRLVTSWQTTIDEVTQAGATFRHAVQAEAR